MSSSNQNEGIDLTEDLKKFFEGSVPHLSVDEKEALVSHLLRAFRGQLVEAAQEENVSVREWARRLKVQPSVVSRQLRDTADLRVSTAALLADALGREWQVELKRRVDPKSGNRNVMLGARFDDEVMSLNGENTVKSGAERMLMTFRKA